MTSTEQEVAEGNQNDSNPRIVYQSFPVRKDWVKFIIGKGGKTIQEIRERIGARVFITDSKKDGGDGENPGGDYFIDWEYVKMSGTPSQVNRVKKRLVSIIFHAGVVGSSDNKN